MAPGFSQDRRQMGTHVAHVCHLVAVRAHALTGDLFSRDPRTTTGAMVGRQPFGDNRLSGTGTKADGLDDLLHVVEPVVVTERPVRHGLAT